MALLEQRLFFFFFSFFLKIFHLVSARIVNGSIHYRWFQKGQMRVRLNFFFYYVPSQSISDHYPRRCGFLTYSRPQGVAPHLRIKPKTSGTRVLHSTPVPVHSCDCIILPSYHNPQVHTRRRCLIFSGNLNLNSLIDIIQGTGGTRKYFKGSDSMQILRALGFLLQGTGTEDPTPSQLVALGPHCLLRQLMLNSLE